MLEQLPRITVAITGYVALPLQRTQLVLPQIDSQR